MFFLIASIAFTVDTIISDTDLLKGKAWKIQKLESYSNANYLLENEEEKYVVRIPHQDSCCFANFQNELHNAKLAHELHFNPIMPVFINEAKGIFITLFLNDAKSPKDFSDPQLIKQIADLIKKLHTSNIGFRNPTSPFLRARVIYQKLQEDHHLIDPQIGLLFSTFFAIQAALVPLSTNRVPCHNDLTPGNILKMPDKVQLIDWEMSGLSDCVWDIASFIVFANLTKEQEDLFLQEYHPDPEDRVQEKLIIYKALVHFNSCIWAYYKYMYKDYLFPKEELKSIYQNQLDVCQKLISESKFIDSLRNLTK